MSRNSKKRRRAERKMYHPDLHGNYQPMGYGYGTGQIVTQPVESCWETELDDVSECSRIPNEKNVYLTPIAYEKIKMLMETFSSSEWLAYLLGDENGENSVVSDLLFPESQAVSGASVNNIENANIAEHKIVGVIHSHVAMGTSASSVDENHLGVNHDISLIASKQGIKLEIAGTARIKTPCGFVKKVKANVKMHLVAEFDRETFIKEAKEKINSRTATVVYNRPFSQPAIVNKPFEVDKLTPPGGGQFPRSSSGDWVQTRNGWVLKKFAPAASKTASDDDWTTDKEESNAELNIDDYLEKIRDMENRLMSLTGVMEVGE